ncbi:hypothetical protein CUMW_278110, partial [Citrus unshiu]
MKSGNLEPALKWAAANSDKLTQNGSDLQLKLHSLQVVEISHGRKQRELSKSSCLFIWARKLESCPYPQLVSQTNWVTVAEELTRQFCNLVGQSYESPLSVTIAAGVQALPPLLKFMTVMAGKKQEWQSMKQLPVPVELDKEFQFHSIFVCPVSKEQTSDDNPPMIMSCGHVLCRQSINKMSKNHSRTFKCPYCPSDIDAAQCRQLCRNVGFSWLLLWSRQVAGIMPY